jgi:riboflavin kinase / FMN adenylyltransferase
MTHNSLDSGKGLIEVVTDWRDLPVRLRGGCVSIGNFDGVHLGHQQLLNQATAHATRLGRPSLVFTFHPHPLAILRPEQAPVPLTDLRRRAQRLAACGVDVMVVCPVNQEFLDWDYHEFFTRVVKDALAPRAMVEGPNFFFGKDRQGDAARLQELCRQSGIELQIVTAQEIEGRMISSSRIRDWLLAGDIELAEAALGCPYRICGRVVAGDGRGRQLGFPTANLAGIKTILPKDGVYSGSTEIDGRCFAVAIHIGPAVTFEQLGGERSPSRVEVHVIGLAEDLYGRELDVAMGRRIRDVQRFESPERLRNQIQVDLSSVKDWAGRFNNPCRSNL